MAPGLLENTAMLRQAADLVELEDVVNGVDPLLNPPGGLGFSTAWRQGILERRGRPICRAAWKAAGPFRGCLGVARDSYPPPLALRMLLIGHGGGSSVLGGCISRQTVSLHHRHIRLQQNGHLDAV